MIMNEAFVENEDELRKAVAGKIPVIHLKPRGVIKFEDNKTLQLADKQEIVGHGCTLRATAQGKFSRGRGVIGFGKWNRLSDFNLYGNKECIGLRAMPRQCYMRVKNIRVANCKTGVQINYGWTARWDDLWVSNCETGVLLHGASVNAMTFRGGHIGRCGTGVMISAKDAQMLTFEMPMEGNNIAIDACGESELLVVEGCYFEGNRTATIRLRSVRTRCPSGTLIAKNWFVREKNAIQVVEAIETRIENNRFVWCDEPIKVGEAAKYTSIGHNSYRSRVGNQGKEIESSIERPGGLHTTVDINAPIRSTSVPK